MPPKRAKVSLKSQLEEAERKGLEKGMDAVLAALKAAHANQLSRYSYISDEYHSLQVRLDAAFVNAAKENQIELVLSLIKAGAQIGACNKEHHSVLFVAVEAGNTELALALLKAGASPNFSGEEKYGTLPLACAANRGDTEIALALLKAGADVHQGYAPEDSHWLINYSAEGDQVELTRAFIRAGARIHPSSHDEFWTPLMSAAMSGKHKSAAVLIKAGCDVNAEGENGKTVLMMAAQGDNEGSLDTIRLLLKAGAEVNSEDKTGRTALICAAEAGRSEAVRSLLSAGADVFSRAQSIPARWGNPAKKGGNAFDVADDAAVKEIIKSEMHRRIAAALSVLPSVPVDVRKKIIRLYLWEWDTDVFSYDSE